MDGTFRVCVKNVCVYGICASILWGSTAPVGVLNNQRESIEAICNMYIRIEAAPRLSLQRWFTLLGSLLGWNLYILFRIYGSYYILGICSSMSTRRTGVNGVLRSLWMTMEQDSWIADESGGPSEVSSLEMLSTNILAVSISLTILF